MRRGVGGAADDDAFHAGAARVAGFGPAVDKDGPAGTLGAAFKVKDRPGGPLGAHDLLLEEHQSLQNRLGPGRAARDVHVHGRIWSMPCTTL